MDNLFKGRLNRTTFLLPVLFLVLIAIVLQKPQVAHYLEVHTAGAIVVLAVLLPLLIWYFAVGARRFHDIGLSGWLTLLLIIPGVQLFLLLMPGTKGHNRFGHSPTSQFDLASLFNNPVQTDRPPDSKKYK